MVSPGINIYQKIAKPLLFRLSADVAHELALLSLRLGDLLGLEYIAAKLLEFENPRLETKVWGRHFKNPLGLAAGFDKESQILPALLSWGFGFIEVGTVTPTAQPGNPKPRMFRIAECEALINRMGFPSKGANFVARRLANFRQGYPITDVSVPIGVNIGKCKTTELACAAADYAQVAGALYHYADFIVINVSSPNTPELRTLQEPARLAEIFGAVRAGSQKIPILVKLAPDLDAEYLCQIIDLLLDCKVDGVIATNTTVSRSGLLHDPMQQGGLSGRPLFARAVQVVRSIYLQSQGKLPIVGVGGISSGEDALRMICAGASLLEIYSALVFQGPAVVAHIKRQLVSLIVKYGGQNISEFIGSGDSLIKS